VQNRRVVLVDERLADAGPFGYLFETATRMTRVKSPCTPRSIGRPGFAGGAGRSWTRGRTWHPAS
jgi:hypothetical protein